MSHRLTDTADSLADQVRACSKILRAQIREAFCWGIAIGAICGAILTKVLT